MMQASGEKGRFDLLSTHPASEARMETLAGLVPAMRPIYAEAARNPAALPTRLAANVRDVTPGTPAPANLRPLSLVNPALQSFKSGEAVLKCDNCALSFSNRRDKLRAYYEQRDWESLAREVLDVGYAQDISWFYLGAAAEGMGLPYAPQYYRQAVTLAGHKDTHCKGQFSDVCNGIDLPRQAGEALNRLGK